MNLLDANAYAIIAITILAGIGIALFFFGSLFTMAAAFGKNDTAFGIAIILFLPLSLLYCALNREHTRYPFRYLLYGSLLITLALLCLLWMNL